MAQIDTHLRIAFADALTLAAQQLDNRLGGTVQQETLEGERKYFDGYNTVAMTERTSRSAANTYQEVGRNRRMIQPAFFEYSELFDAKRDEGRLMRAIEPNGPYSMAIAAAYHRQVDSLIVTAFDAIAFGGVDGTTSFAFDSTNQDIATETGDMSLAKLRQARAILKASDSIIPGEEVFLACHPDNIDQLLADAQVRSVDFNAVKVLVDGEVDSFMGFKFIQSTLLANTSSFAYTRDAIILGQEGALDVNIDDLPARGHSTQFAAYATIAAVRTYENKVVRLTHT